MSSSSTPKSGWSTPSWACTAAEVRPTLRPTTVAPAVDTAGDAGALDGVRRGGVGTDQVADGWAGSQGLLGEVEPVGRLLDGCGRKMGGFHVDTVPRASPPDLTHCSGRRNPRRTPTFFPAGGTDRFPSRRSARIVTPWT